MIRLLSPSATSVDAPMLKIIQPYSATVRREEGGAWELTATMAADELDMIAPGADQAILLADTPEGPQPFRVRYVERDGPILTVRAPHQYFDADGVLVRHISEVNATPFDVLAALQTAAISTPVPSLPWTLVDSTTGTATNSYTADNKTLTVALSEIATLWGFYIRPDGFEVVCTETRGVQSGYALVYGANLQEASVSYDWTDVATAIQPVGENEITPALPIYPTPAPPYSAPHYVVRDYETGQEKGNTETETAYKNRVLAALTPLAMADVRRLNAPAINYTVTGYVAPGAGVKLGDTVRCIDSRYGLDLNMACVGYDFDPEQGIYNSVEFGSIRKNLRALRPKS